MTIEKIGFWYNHEENNKDFPVPVPRDRDVLSQAEMIEHGIFIHKLKTIESILIVDHLKNNHEDNFVVGYRGSANCRLCDVSAGSHEYRMADTDGTEYHWPEGYMHYLEKHYIEPDPEFKKFIESLHGSLIGCCHRLEDYKPGESD